MFLIVSFLLFRLLFPVTQIEQSFRRNWTLPMERSPLLNWDLLLALF